MPPRRRLPLPGALRQDRIAPEASPGGRPMRLLLDADLPRQLCTWFSGRGDEAVHVRERGWGRAGDEELAKLAMAEDRIVVTRDRMRARRLHLAGCAAIWLDCRSETREALEAYLASSWWFVRATFEPPAGTGEA